ncbi:MAG TPA: tetratricopeptide repeat protein, partial [Rhabdaerophilum sp.]|nr:tetratricopeptide repeat protein [Rhabdaerophilum sp.]
AGGCSGRLSNFTGSLSQVGGNDRSAAPSTDNIRELGRRYDARPGAKEASLAYAAALRANGQHPQAVAVLERASVANVGDRDVAAAYGKALADIGRFEEAARVLSQAHTEDRPSWRVLSTLGSVADQSGNHRQAREYYHRALQIAPDEPIVLNNLGLSYMLTKELKLAEETLRKAANRSPGNARIQGNLALVLRLQGKNSEATAIEIQGVASSPPAKASAGKAVAMRAPTNLAPKARKEPEKKAEAASKTDTLRR